MRAVIDTGIVVRAVIKPYGSVAPVLFAARQARYTLVYSDELLSELVDVLNRPRIRQKYGVSDSDIRDVVGTFLTLGELVSPTRPIQACRDPKDNKVLEAAVEGRTDVIISGDEDLLVLSSFEGISIVGPSRFLQLLESEEPRQPGQSNAASR